MPWLLAPWASTLASASLVRTLKAAGGPLTFTSLAARTVATAPGPQGVPGCLDTCAATGQFRVTILLLQFVTNKYIFSMNDLLGLKCFSFLIFLTIWYLLQGKGLG